MAAWCRFAKCRSQPMPHSPSGSLSVISPWAFSTWCPRFPWMAAGSSVPCSPGANPRKKPPALPRGPSNFILVFVALFVYLGASQESSAVRGRILTAGFPVSAAMLTDFRVLRHGDTIRDAGNLLLATSQHDFPVMHGDSVVGLLTRRRLVRAMMRDGAEAYVAGAMDREFPRFSPETSLQDVLSKVSAHGSCALVMDADDQLLGMVTSENVSEFLLLRQAKMVQPE